MPMTYDGRLVRPGRDEAPSLRDIALSLSRMPRFAGHTRGWWSVLDHSVFMYLMAVEKDRLDFPDLHLAILLHDAHEAITGDVPSDVKLAGVRAQQAALDLVIVGEHFLLGAEHWAELKALVKEYDRRALHAEAWLLGPPGIVGMNNEEYEQTFGRRPLLWRQDVSFLATLRALGRFQATPDAGLTGENVKKFIGLVEHLQRGVIADTPRNLIHHKEGRV